MSTIYRTSETAAGAWPVKPIEFPCWIFEHPIQLPGYPNDLPHWERCCDWYGEGIGKLKVSHWSPDFERPAIDPTQPQAKAASIIDQTLCRQDEALQGIDYAMNWRNHKPDAVQFATGIADARQWVIDAGHRITDLERELAAARATIDALTKERDAARKEVERFAEITKRVKGNGRHPDKTVVIPKDAEGRAAYWKARANGAEDETRATLAALLDEEAKRDADVDDLRADNAKLAQERDALNLLVRSKSSLGQGDIDGFVADFNELVEEGVNVEAFMNRIRSITGKTALASTAPAPKPEGGKL